VNTFEYDETLYLDGIVEGKYKGEIRIDDREGTQVIFAPKWGLGRTVYGLMPHHAGDREYAGNQELKLVSYSLMLVHPSNLHRDRNRKHEI